MPCSQVKHYLNTSFFDGVLGTEQNIFLNQMLLRKANIDDRPCERYTYAGVVGETVKFFILLGRAKKC